MKKEVKEKRIITEHPELRWWFNAIAVRANSVNAIKSFRRIKCL